MEHEIKDSSIITKVVFITYGSSDQIVYKVEITTFACILNHIAYFQD